MFSSEIVSRFGQRDTICMAESILNLTQGKNLGAKFRVTISVP